MPKTLTDRTSLLRQRHRAMSMARPARFLHDEAIFEVQERLQLVNRSFQAPALVTGFPQFWAPVLPDAQVCADSATLSLTEASHDLIVHAMALHWADDPVGQLVQCRRALRPDGLFLAAFFGGQTLADLRRVLAQAESDLRGGIAPRVAPMAEIRDLGGLLQRAGFALPVADSITLQASYLSLTDLMRDLRAMGETNALASRDRRPLPRGVLTQAESYYRRIASSEDGRLIARFELILLTGWAPHQSQPQALRPGSAKTRLADALGGQETPLPRGDAFDP
ncbi:MAG: methyltransferase domain-containing protein [Pseudomonadota bacterium]